MKRRWSDLSQGQRRVLVGVAVVEGVLKIAALIDMKNRPASEIRGPKWLWATSVAVIGSAGVLPVSYFLVGRRATSR
ncbi:MAG TPA: hypothetical protein VNN79_02210 [Actinomycetota bacterium]|nr:hypothetical protein [Actinomycetota bacterium]